MKKTLLLALFLLVPAFAFAQNTDKTMEMLRSDLRAAKTQLLTDSMKLTDAQGTKFWPIQREYETELAKLNDQRIAMIKDYAASYGSMTDAKAGELMNSAFKLGDQRSALLKKYAGKVSKAVSPTAAARFAQTESYVHSLLDVQIRGEVPLVP